AAIINHARNLDQNPQLGTSKQMAQQTMGLKVSASELAFESSIHCFRTMGGRGFTRHYSAPIGLLDPYCMIHGGGSNYVMGDAESRRFFKPKPPKEEFY
ncbi:MAG: hypothetical protein KAX10_08655, partial [Candidatus Lokiarchaeota archaeon]|nr:hypothetical protein [Candidatus Lokiarchaeota archaeon]